MDLLRVTGSLVRSDGKTYRHHPFVVPPGLQALRIAFAYDRGGDFPHSLVTLQVFDPHICRGAGHRFAPRQTMEIGEHGATPGFLPGPLAAGEWMVEVDVHCVIPRADGRASEYTLEIEGLVRSLPGGPEEGLGVPSTGQPAGESEGPAAEPSRWLRGECHIHSEHSDGRWTIADIAERARGRGLDFLFLTDHNTASGVDLLRARLGDAVAVHPGIELTTYHGHALALGADRWLDWRTGLRGRTADDMARDVHAAGAFFVVAHPDALPDDVCTGCRWTYADFDPSLADAVEVWGGLWGGPEERNQGCLDLWRSWLNAGHRLTATGATDAHRPEDWEGAVPLTYVRAADASLSAILEALRAGRTYVSSGPFLELRALRGGQVVGEVGDSVEGSSRPLLEARCHGRPPAELRLIANGQVFARQFVTGHGRLAVPADPGHAWYCAELWSPKGDVLLAVTSALYLA